MVELQSFPIVGEMANRPDGFQKAKHLSVYALGCPCARSSYPATWHLKGDLERNLMILDRQQNASWVMNLAGSDKEKADKDPLIKYYAANNFNEYVVEDIAWKTGAVSVEVDLALPVDALTAEPLQQRQKLWMERHERLERLQQRQGGQQPSASPAALLSQQRQQQQRLQRLQRQRVYAPAALAGPEATSGNSSTAAAALAGSEANRGNSS